MPDPIDEARKNLALLDLQPGCSWEEVRDRYRFLAKVWHPDRFGSDAKAIARAETQFKRVNDAYQWLVTHRHLVESLAARHGPGAEYRGSPDPASSASSDSPDPRAHGRRDSGAPPTPRLPSPWTVERFLWGVIAAFSLVALTFLVASGTFSDMLEGLDPAPTSNTEKDTVTGASGASGGHGVESRFVTASRLYIRSRPTRSAPAVAVLEGGARVRVRPGNGEWLEVLDERGDRLGWLHGDYVSPRPEGSGAGSSSASVTRDLEPIDMTAAFAATAQSDRQSPPPQASSAGNPESETEEVDLIRGAWKPADPDPVARRARQQAARSTDPDLEHWSGWVDGPAPPDLPQISVRLYEDATADGAIGAVVYWRSQGSCTYSLDLLEESGDWIRTRQVPREAGCVPQGEVWLRLGDSEMTGIWHRADGRRWFAARLGKD